MFMARVWYTVGDENENMSEKDTACMMMVNLLHILQVVVH